MQNLVRWIPAAGGLSVGLILVLLSGLIGSSWLMVAGAILLVMGLAWIGVQFFRRRSDTNAAASDDLHSAWADGAPAAGPRRREAPDEPDDLVSEMLWQQRYTLLLRPQVAGNLDEEQLAQAKEALEENMALVPEGDVFLSQPEERGENERAPQRDGRLVQVEPALLDRYPVTNHEFKQFVDAGGYEQMALWDSSIWPAVFGFVDTTGHAGPRYWKNGTYPRGEDDHPVVGVSWHEANAYARWVGKRLPADAEWVKAGCWPMPVPRGLPKQRRFPWGDAWEPDRANIWSSGIGRTCPVTGFADGASVAGVYGLVGNVWEWTADPFGLWHSWAADADQNGALRSLRGGAFDTYFESQASCQFQSGDSPLARKHNIGFRCAIGLCDLRGTAPKSNEQVPAEQEQELVCEEV